MALVAVALISLLAGCSMAKNYKDPAGPLHIAPCGFKYKIIEIEGKRFIAYQTAHSYWEVTRLDD